jgi:PmbA protein
MSDIDAGDAPDIVERALERALACGAAAADAVLVRSGSSEARVRGTEIDFVKQSNERGLGIRVLHRDPAGGAPGLSSAVTSTSDLSKEAVDRMAEDTVAIARATASDPHAGLPAGGFAGDLPDLRLFDAADEGVSIEARIDDALRAEAAARAVDPRIVNSEGSQVGSDSSTITYGNTGGFLASYRSASHSLFSEPLARDDGSGMQRDYWMTVGRSLASLDDPDRVGRMAAERALRRLGSRRVATCEVPVIFDERTAPSLIGQLASCASGYALYREASFLRGRLGERVASELVTIVDDGRLPGGLGSKPFDGEGLPTRRNRIVDRGELQTWLLDSYSARKLGLRSTGNAVRGIGSAPSVGTTNLWLEPGSAGSLDDMIAETGRGLLVTELIGMGFNAVTGDYSRGAAGLWIEGGEIAYPVEEITIAGNLDTMLRSIDRVGSQLQWFGARAAPPVRIASMTIAGE